MRYYVEINGESSLDIQGLMIQSLPSISKPLMRSKQETIDGRDGDIVTKLGYSAYDKTLKIGLWGNYDINEVIAFFNQEGTITFSNEPDKYYRFTILNRDDYVSQLDKFRTCTIALHCQPYKYKLNEEPEELENEYVEQEGTSLTFNNTLVAPMNIDLKGNTLQNGTPTPSSPIPINNVSGDNDIVVCGKNLFDYANVNYRVGYILNDSGVEITDSTGGYTRNYSQVQPNTEYTFSYMQSGGGNRRLYFYDINKNFINRTSLISTSSTITFTTPSNAYYVNVQTYTPVDTNLSTWQLEQGNQATTYEAYNGTTYNIDLPVENLLDVSKGRLGSYGYDFTNSNGNLVVNGTASSAVDFYFCIAGQYNDDLINYLNNRSATYTLSNDKGYEMFFRLSSGYKQTTATITPQDTIINCFIRIPAGTYNDLTIKVQLEKGTKVNSFTPYGTTPIELNKIGTYQDYFYKENDKWYLHKEIGKVLLNGSEDEDWRFPGINNNYAQFNLANISGWNNCNSGENGSLFKNKYFKYYADAGSPSKNDSGIRIWGNGNPKLVFSVPTNILTTGSELSSFKTWLSNNSNYFYYVLATHTNTEITYTPLIEQLESIKNAMSKEGTTNVNQVNNDAPFIITASVLSGTDSITLTNEGNTTSKPSLTITGSGVVGVYLENIQMFNISLGTNETIIIDTENMEAYYGSQLKNRQVTGDYSNFALQSGTNNLKFTGSVTNVEITNYNRWI